MSTPNAAFLDDPLAIFANAPQTAQPTAAAPPPPVVTPPPSVQPAAPPTTAVPPQPATPPSFTSLDQLAQGGQAPAVVGLKQNSSFMSLDQDEQIQTSEFDVFKGRADWTERIGILAPTKMFGGRLHYIENPPDKKGQYYCSSVFERRGGSEVCVQVAPCCERLEASRWRFAALVIHYMTQMNGQLADPFQFKLKVWRFTDRMFGQLQTTNREWKLSEHDLLIKTEDEKFQRLKYDVTRECIYRRPDFLTKYGPTVAQWAQQMLPKLDRALGRRIQPQDWIPLLTGQTQGVGRVVDAPVQDIGDVLSRGL